ncbi:MAG: cytochrome P450 [Dehalococcoidia bacterium]|nr:cytochrome P450 [Dehalococcoidia bacterium]
MNEPVTFNPFVPSYRKNPYLQLGRLQARDPVHRSDALQAWVLTRYDDCQQVTRDVEGFSSDARVAREALEAAARRQGITDAPMGLRLPSPGRSSRTLGEEPTVIGSDPPGHTRLRGIINRAFTPRAVEVLRPRIEAITAALLDEQPATGTFDAVEALAQPLPAIVIAEMLGIPPEDRTKFREWSRVIAGTTDLVQTPERIAATQETTRALVDYFGGFIAERERAPREDLISTLLRAQDEGGRLTRNELLGFCILLLVAGNETTTNLIGGGLRALLAHPEAMATLRAHPEAMPAAVEEMLRWDSPVQGLVRFSRNDVEVGGTRIPAGGIVICMLGAANRDPAQFPDPERFDITREDVRHLSFGYGIHYCLGAPLARAEADIALRAVLARWGTVDPAGEPEMGGTFLIRGPQRLPVAVAP